MVQDAYPQSTYAPSEGFLPDRTVDICGAVVNFRNRSICWRWGGGCGCGAGAAGGGQLASHTPISLSLVNAKPGDFAITDFPCDVQQISKNKNLYLSQVRESNYSHLSIFPIRWWIYDEPILRFKA